MPQRIPDMSGRDKRTDRENAASMLSQALAGSPQDLAQTIQRLGGPKQVAALVGRSVRTVQRWAAGSIRSPKADARLALNRADIGDRLSRRGINVDAGGKPLRPIAFQAAGNVSVQGPSKTPTYEYFRRIGAQGGIGVDSDTIAAMLDRIAHGDHEGALQLLERELTRDYANCGDNYNPETGQGFRFDNLSEAEFFTDAAGQPLYPDPPTSF